jgi:type IV pilus assembly protein PilP
MMSLLSSQGVRIVIMAAALVLGGCARTDVLSDLQVFVNDVKSRPGAEVEPVPTFEPYEAFVYSAASMRSPFDIPLGNR